MTCLAQVTALRAGGPVQTLPSPCSERYHLDLERESITASTECSAGVSVYARNQVEIAQGGELSLHVGRMAVFGDGFHVDEGGVLTVEVNPVLIPGEPINCDDGSGLLPWINVPPVTAPPAPQLLSEVVDERGVTLLTYEHVSDAWLDAPAIAGKRRRFVVTLPPGYDPGTTHPLMMWLHGGCADYDDHNNDLEQALIIPVLHVGDPNTDYENEFENCIIEGKVPHLGYMSDHRTYWDAAASMERTEGGMTSEAVFVDYTQRRYRYTLDFVEAQYPIDSNRIFVRGHSKGGAGTVYTTLFNQDRIAGGISDVLRPQLMHADSPTPQVCNNLGYNAFEITDMAWWMENRPQLRDFWIQTDHGKDDPSAFFHWFNFPSGPATQSFFDTLEEARVGHYATWDEGGHEKNRGNAATAFRLDPVLGYHWWDSDWNVIWDPVTYLRLDLSFPAFSDYSYNQSYGQGPLPDECGGACNGDVEVPGDNQYRGSIAGALNRHLRWNSNTIVDEPDTYAIEVMILDDPSTDALGGTCASPPGGYPRCYDDYAGVGTETVDITPRRLQRFEIAVGELILWQSSIGATGTVTADEHGVVTIPGFEVTTVWRTLTLRRGASLAASFLD
jgi:predicted esterase